MGVSSGGITNAGKAAIAGKIGGVGSVADFDYLELGDDSTAFSATQTALGSAITGNGLGRASATASLTTTTVTNDTLKLVHEWTASGSETVREIGAFNAASAGTMVYRGVLSMARSLTSGSTYELTVKLIIA